MATDPVPPPSGRIIVAFHAPDPRELYWEGAGIARPEPESQPFDVLVDEVRSAAGDLDVVEGDAYRAAADAAAKDARSRLAGAPDAASVRALLAEFARLYPDRVEDVRSSFLIDDMHARAAAVSAAPDTDARVALLERAAADYGVVPSPEDRFTALRGGGSFEWLYGYVRYQAERDDPAAAARAPRGPKPQPPQSPLPVELADVVSLVVPTLTGIALDRLVDAAAAWLRRRRAPTPVVAKIVKVYGPDGELLTEVAVPEVTPAGR
jgi:hypothetical protein